MTAAARRSGAAVIACATLALGCGDDGRTRITPAQETDLHTLVERGRTAAAAGDLQATRAALDRLDAGVRALRDSGALDAGRAAELLKISAVTKLKAARTLQPATAAAPATSVAAPPAAATRPVASPPAGKTPKGRGNLSGKAKGKGKGKKGG